MNHTAMMEEEKRKPVALNSGSSKCNIDWNRHKYRQRTIIKNTATLEPTMKREGGGKEHAELRIGEDEKE